MEQTVAQDIYKDRELTHAEFYQFSIGRNGGQTLLFVGLRLHLMGAGGHPMGPNIALNLAVPITETTTFEQAEREALDYGTVLLSRFAAETPKSLRAVMDRPKEFSLDPE